MRRAPYQQLALDPKLRDAALRILASPLATENNKRIARIALRVTSIQVN